MPADNALLRDAQAIDRALHTIRREMRRPAERDIQRIPLTAPQMRALTVLTLPENLNGMSLKSLTQEMDLSQSTVSGIVDRLERMGLVHRQPDAQDRRVTRVEAGEMVKNYVQKDLAERRLGALLTALEKASPQERGAIRQAMEMLERLLTAQRKK